MTRGILPLCLLAAGMVPLSAVTPEGITAFTGKYCALCHNSSAKTAGLDLSTLSFDLTDAGNFAEWVKVHDRLSAGEMPPEGMVRKIVCLDVQ